LPEESTRHQLPRRINRLNDFAKNLWWSWNEEGRQLFRSLDYGLWRTSGHNPVKQLNNMSEEKLETAARDPAFLELYDSVMTKFDGDMLKSPDWCTKTDISLPEAPIAYFSAEYALHNSLPIYAGGLGVLAGDICKESSDRGLPLVAVGFMYPQGYFRQRISDEGDQQEDYVQLDFNEAPISPCAWPFGCGPLIHIELGNRRIFLKVWEVKVGRVNLYLLDTNIEENSIEDRNLSARLYTADQEERLRQLIVLGVGGVQALKELQINPIVWHANEDHTAFMMLERLKMEKAKGLSFEQALENVKKNTIFTTHTPVPAGHHVFNVQLLDRYARNLWEPLNIDKNAFLALGQFPGLEPDKFNLTAFAFRLSIYANAVSKLHGEVTRRMWQVLWPQKPISEIPIFSVTNGVHVPSWQAPEIRELCMKYTPAQFLNHPDIEEYWNCLDYIPNELLWQVRQTLKSRLILTIQDRAQRRWSKGTVAPQQLTAMGTLLDPYALTITFARRFTQYKRPYLLFSNIQRLKKILTNPEKPVQLIFAGKSHPADYASKQLLKQVYQASLDRGFEGRIAFIEDYDLNLARELVRGVDVWLNMPRRLQEASGTSGMKAALNGTINLSVLDGWWAEAYNGKNGWAIGDFQTRSEDEDERDADSLYNLLENEITKRYYERDRAGIPHRWINTIKESIKTIAPAFSACRMMRQYAQQMYLPIVAKENLVEEINIGN
jgi:starch phosphorylase